MTDDGLAQRAGLHAALGDVVRLGIVEELARSDRTSSELARRFGVASNLLAHHLSVLERVGLVDRSVSSGDGRRRYVRLRRDRLDELAVGVPVTTGPVLFVCTHNSARSQLAAALWRSRTGQRATSAGTHPAEGVHRGAVAAADRAGLDLAGAVPRQLEPAELDRSTVVTVCDRAHEELDGSDRWLHWSIPDPVAIGTPAAFDAAVAALDGRIAGLVTTTTN